MTAAKDRAVEALKNLVDNGRSLAAIHDEHSEPWVSAEIVIAELEAA